MMRGRSARDWSVSIRMIALVAVATAPLWASAGKAHAQGRDFLEELNAPILRVTDENKACNAYFEALSLMDIFDDRIIIAQSRLEPGAPGFRDAIDWAGEPSQQEAINLLLTRVQGRNVMAREIFGLPYGTKYISEDMDIEEFACFVSKEKIAFVDFAYMPQIDHLIALLRAEAHRRITEGDAKGGIEAMMGVVRLSRQMCDRAYFEEMKWGMTLFVDSLIEMREYMWYYRETLSVKDYKTIAADIELLDTDLLELPTADRLIGEQLLGQLYTPGTNMPQKDRFPSVMAEFESRDQPLKRFTSAAKWRRFLEEKSEDEVAWRNEFAMAHDDILGNWALRWRVAAHDSLLTTQKAHFDTLHPVKFAAVLATVSDHGELFAIRQRIYAHQRGTGTSAGLMAFVKREGGQLVPGVKAEGFAIPLKLSQIHPNYVNSGWMLEDAYALQEQDLHYTRVQKRDERYVTQSFTVRTAYGSVTLQENWPILYSVGVDGLSDHAALFAPGLSDDESDDADIIFWPPVDLIAQRKGITPR